MLYFADPYFLYLLLLVPVIPVVYALVRRRRRRLLDRFGDRDLVRALMPSWSGAKGWLRIVLLTVAFMFFVIGISRPLTGARVKEHKTEGAQIMICLDVSNSMLAQDYTPNRLERAKLAISKIVDKLSEDRIGLVIFAGSSFVQLPITTDFISAKMFMRSVDTGSVATQGTAIGDAILTAASSFSTDKEETRAIVVITDGENHEDDPVEAARQAAEAGIRVYTIGVGSPEGKLITLDSEILRDKDGNPVVTCLDEECLKDVAAAGGGIYVRAGNEEFGLNPIIDDLRRLRDEEQSVVMFQDFDEQFMFFFAVAFVLLAAEVLVGERKNKRRLFE